MCYLWYELKNCQKYIIVHAQKECFSFFNEMVAMVLKKNFHQTKIEVNLTRQQRAYSVFSWNEEENQNYLKVNVQIEQKHVKP